MRWIALMVVVCCGCQSTTPVVVTSSVVVAYKPGADAPEVRAEVKAAGRY